MNSFSALSLPVAVALALVSAAGNAEDRPNTTLVQKSKAATAAPSKSSKGPVQTATQPRVANTGAKQGEPSGGRASPASEGAHEGCHGMDSDA